MGTECSTIELHLHDDNQAEVRALALVIDIPCDTRSYPVPCLPERRGQPVGRPAFRSRASTGMPSPNFPLYLAASGGTKCQVLCRLS